VGVFCPACLEFPLLSRHWLTPVAVVVTVDGSAASSHSRGFRASGVHGTTARLVVAVTPEAGCKAVTEVLPSASAVATPRLPAALLIVATAASARGRGGARGRVR